ncbi:MAG: thiamine diphosphokinase, partial [Bacteroidales bacterium]
MITSNKCILVANGSFPEHAYPLSLLQSGDIVIACDGAVNKLLAHGITPDYIVGDLDSISDDIRSIYAHIIFHNPDQETNDLTKAVRFALEKGFRQVSILGATGIREDHTLANISLLSQYQRDFDSVEMITDWGVFRAIHSTTRFESYKSQKIS